MELTARFPWWVGVIAALIAFVILRLTSNIEVTPTGASKDVGGLMFRTFIKAGATLGNGCFLSCFLLAQQSPHLSSASDGRFTTTSPQSSSSRAVGELTWQDFERLIGEYFNRRGFSVIETGGGGADGGVDLTMKKGADRYLVQCKQWRAMSVGVEPVRELYGVMAAHRAVGSFVVTSGRFTEEAKRFASGREIELVDGAQLERGIRQQPTSPKKSEAIIAATKPTAVAVERVCATCGSAMVFRKATKGSSAGQSFYGCSKFPRCRGTRPA